MHIRLALALSVSVLLIGVASWYRFKTVEHVRPSIIAVESSGSLVNDDYESIINEFAKPKTASSTASQEILSNADLIGRGMILDYVGVAASGQATEANLTNLANEYVGSIRTLNKAPTINPADIKVVVNNNANFLIYSDTFKQIHYEYVTYITDAGVQNKNITALGADLYTSTRVFSIAYENAALKLKNIPVPASLVSAHIELVNRYYSSATAMKAISDTQNDPAAAFAGLVTLNENLNKEDSLVEEIRQILISNGI